eukprot:746554-Hanusia_phi.AAC.3
MQLSRWTTGVKSALQSAREKLQSPSPSWDFARLEVSIPPTLSSTPQPSHPPPAHMRHRVACAASVGPCSSGMMGGARSELQRQRTSRLLRTVALLPPLPHSPVLLQPSCSPTPSPHTASLLSVFCSLSSLTYLYVPLLVGAGAGRMEGGSNTA